MSYHTVVILLSGLVELVNCRTACGIMRMRSNPAYYAAHMTFYCISWALTNSGMPDPLRAAIIIPFTTLILPIGLSVGPLRTRLLRTMLINLTVVVVEMTGAGIYALLSGGAAYAMEVGPDNIVLMVVIYAILLLESLFICEVLIVMCGRADGAQDADVEMPVVFLMMSTFFLFTILYLRFYMVDRISVLVAVTTTLFVLVNLGICLSFVTIARNDAKTRRRLSDRAALIRQNRHMRAEVTASTRRAADLRLLRHDLANQIGVVHELVEQGRLGDADRYLAALQRAAHEFREVTHV